jgi:hypothetical protein
MFDAARPMLQREADGKTAFRLIGVGISHLSPLAQEDPAGGGLGPTCGKPGPRRARHG